MEPVSLWHGKGFWQNMYFWPVYIQKLWSVEVIWFYYSYHAASVLLCCGIVLTKNACGARPPLSLSYDDAGGSPRKGGLFLLNVVGVDLFYLRRTSWHFCLVLSLVHQSSLKFCPNNSLWLSEKMPVFSFIIVLDLCSFIKALRTDKRLFTLHYETLAQAS